MKRILPILLALLLLTGCGTALPDSPGQTEPAVTAPQNPDETLILLKDNTASALGVNADAVVLSHDILYYEYRLYYENGNPYGAGDAPDRHDASEAQAHTVVNITAPGTYRITGTLNPGQIRVDLGEEARRHPDAVVNLILSDAHITCTVAPAIVFWNVYECDSGWSIETAQAHVDTGDAGANLILAGENTVKGSYVAEIYTDDGTKTKLWKQDGAIYSYMSLNVSGEGSLDITAENEGIDTELHLSVNSGNITIHSQNDGINTGEDSVSVTTINGGTLQIFAGLGGAGDGIDSSGYLVVNGGTVLAFASPYSDGGLDSSSGTCIHGGTVVALGAATDWAEGDSDQVTMNLQFHQSLLGSLLVTDTEGNAIFGFDSGTEGSYYSGVILSSPLLEAGAAYHIYQGSKLTGESENGLFRDIRAYSGGSRQKHTGGDVFALPDRVNFFSEVQNR